MSAYDPVAEIYDEWQSRYGSFTSFVLPRLEAVTAGFRDVSSFLDLGCGTGTLLLALGERHPALRLAGVDASAAMLARARGKPGAERVEWLCAPLDRPLPFAGFAAAGAFFNTLNHLPDAAALERTFGCVAATLAPRGRFLFDVNNLQGFERWWGDGTTSYRGPDWTLEIATRLDRTAGRARAILRVEHAGVRSESSLEERLFPDDTITAALTAAGFTVERRELWRPYADGVPGATFWVARRHLG